MTTHPLLEALRSRSEPLFGAARQLVERAKEILPHTLSTFPSGTAHGPEHTTTVERLARMLLSDVFLSQLSDYELFYLVLSCHYHDLGMAGTEADNETAEAREQIRRDHAVRIGETLISRWAELGFDTPRDAEILAEICRGHRPRRSPEGGATWDEVREDAIVGFDVRVRLRLLAALIYTADELHLGADRAPRRVRDWKKIRNEESRRHWERHAAVHGPVPTADKLKFEIVVNTVSFEGDLRITLAKALSALRDLRREAKNADIDAALPGVQIQWDRKPMFRLLAVEAMSDDVPRPVSDIALTVQQKFDAVAQSMLSIDAAEVKTPDVASEIRRILEDWQRQGILAADPLGNVRLSTGTRESQLILELVRKADEIDGLFKGAFARSHEFRLYSGVYGQRYVRDAVFPLIRLNYSIDLAIDPPESPLRIVVETVPEASRLIGTASTMPSNIVRRELLSLYAVSAAFTDCYRDPSLLLDARFRTAFRNLTAVYAPGMGNVLNFLIELALVGGYSYDELGKVAVPTGSSGEDAPVAPGPSVVAPRISLRQSNLATEAITRVGIPYLLFASRRTRVPLSLSPHGGLPLEIAASELENVAERAGGGFVITIGPGEPDVPAHVGIRCLVDVDEDASVVRLAGFPVSSDDGTSSPLFIRMPPAGRLRPGGHGGLEISLRQPNVTVGDLRKVHLARRVLVSERGQLELRVGDAGHLVGRITQAGLPALQLPMGMSEAVVAALVEALDGDVPTPWYQSSDLREAIETSDADAIRRAFASAQATPLEQKLRVTSITLELLNGAGVALDERFLDFLDVRFPAPQISASGEITQEEFNAVWNERPESVTLFSSTPAEVGSVAALVREWVANPVAPFPLEIGPGGDDLPDAHTFIEMVFEPSRDRVWYVEDPVRIRLRPATLEDQYRLEEAFWTARGDNARVTIVRERMQILLGDAEGNGAVAD